MHIVNEEKASLEATVNMKKKRRPTGLEISDYEGCNNWSYHQWAWEFLRRNEEYIADCKEVRDGKKSKMAVARKYGLKKFRGYKCNYIHKSGLPKFSITSPFVWSDLNMTKKKPRKIKLNLHAGEMIIRLDLASAIEHTGAIDKQVIEAVKLIEKNVSDFKSSYKSLSKAHKRQEETFGIYLRLLDLKADKKSNLICGKILLTKKVNSGADNDDLRQDIKQRLRQAKELSTNDYKYLSVRDGAPLEGTVIPLEVNG
jgi:hypothetical protein